MAVTNGWGKAVENNTNGFGKYENTIDAGSIYAVSHAGETALTAGGAFSNTKSISFDGVDDILYLYDGTISNLPSEFSIGASDSYSFSFWIYQNTTSSNNFIFTLRGTDPYLRFQTNYHSGTDSYRAVLTVRDDNRVSISESSDSTNLVNRNQWNHVVGVIDRTASKLYVYVNGVVTGTGTSLGSLAGLTEVTDVAVGADPYPSGSSRFEFEGNIDEVAIFNSALSSSDVTAIYNSGTPTDLSSYTSLVSWYRMGDGDTFPTITDNKGDNDGTMTNMASDDIIENVP